MTIYRSTQTSLSLLGGSYTSYDKDPYPINLNYTFRGLTDDLPLCFNFPRNLITPSKEGVSEPPRKQFWQILQHPNFQIKQEIGWFWYYRPICPGSLTPINPCSSMLHQNIPIVLMLLLQTSYGKLQTTALDTRYGNPVTYNSKIDYRMLGGGNYLVQDWSNPNPSQDPGSVPDYVNRFSIWKDDSVPWPLAASRWHHNQFVPPMLSYTTKGKTFWQPEIWRAELPPPVLLYLGQRTIPPTLCWLVYPPLKFLCSLTTLKSFIYRWTIQVDQM